MTCLALKNRRLIRKLAQAMRRMSPHDRKIFLGHFVEQATFIELAHLHSISIAEVEAALRRGLEIVADVLEPEPPRERSDEHTSELQSLMRPSYAVLCLNKTTHRQT